MVLQLETSFTLILCGPSSCGKTSWTCHLLNNLDYMVDKPIDKIIWCYAEQGSIPSIKKNLKPDLNVKYVQGIPDSFENPSNKEMLIVIDDLMMEGSSKQIAELFTKGSHHNNLNIILIMQNMFFQSKYSRSISLNTKYMCIFKSPRDGSQFRFLANQIFPEASKSLYNVYKTITDEHPYAYLFIDLSQKINNLLRFRTNIFNKNYSTVYCAPIVGGSVQNETFGEEQVYALCTETGQAKIT